MKQKLHSFKTEGVAGIPVKSLSGMPGISTSKYLLAPAVKEKGKEIDSEAKQKQKKIIRTLNDFFFPGKHTSRTHVHYSYLSSRQKETKSDQPIGDIRGDGCRRATEAEFIELEPNL